MLPLNFTTGNILCVDVPINDDNLCEANEVFNVILTTDDEAVTFDLNSGIVTIVDDDSKLEMHLCSTTQV